jgi:hypothetical protein
MTDDDQHDNTPREYQVSNSERHAHYAHYPPGTPIVDAVAVDQRIDNLETRVEEQRLDIASLLASRRAWRWIAGICLPMLLAAVTTVQLWAIDRVSTSERATGRSEATIEAIQFRLNLLEGYVHELLRHADIDPHGTVAVTGP